MDIKKNLYKVRYIEDNIVFGENEVRAYYELSSYNYNFLSLDEKFKLYNIFYSLISSYKEGNIHALLISTEKSVRDIQENCKNMCSGSLLEVARNRIDGQTEVFLDEIGENSIEYKFYIGFSLNIPLEDFSITALKKQLKATVDSFIKSFQNMTMGDFYEISKEDIYRYKGLENLLYERISSRFHFRKVNKNDIGYIVSHLSSEQGVNYDDYKSKQVVYENEKNNYIRLYDILEPSRAVIEEKPKYLKIIRDENSSYVSYLVMSVITKELTFPSSELFYHQQKHLRFPVDISMNIEVIDNKKALKKVRNKKKVVDDAYTHSVSSGVNPTDSVENAYYDSLELESSLSTNKGSFYKLSYIVRVSASSIDELKMRRNAVIDFYDDNDIKLITPYGDMIGFHKEFFIGAGRYIEDYVQYVEADFLASLGFGALQKLGDDKGIYVGINMDSGQSVYIDPSLPAKNMGTATSSLSTLFVGSTGSGKSMACKLINYYIVVMGGKSLMLDPNAECSNFKRDLPEIAHEISIVKISSGEENRGLLDPFSLLSDIEDSKALARDLICFLLGISPRDEAYIYVKKAIKNAIDKGNLGMLYVLDELLKIPEAKQIAMHLESFIDDDFALLLFSRGESKLNVSLDKKMTILQIDNLQIPDEHIEPKDYTPTNLISLAVFLAISSFAFEFMKSERAVFKSVVIDEAWSILKVPEGKNLMSMLSRAGRKFNCGLYPLTQNTSDVDDDRLKNNIGMKFAFRSTDINEIKNTLEFFNLDSEDENNINDILNFENGQCLFCDSYGRVGKLYFDTKLYSDLYYAFDTSPSKDVKGR